MLLLLFHLAFQCGAVLTDEIGEFYYDAVTSTSQTDNSMNCTWIIKANGYQKIDLAIYTENNNDSYSGMDKPLKVTNKTIYMMIRTFE